MGASVYAGLVRSATHVGTFNTTALRVIDIAATASPLIVPAVAVAVAKLVGASWPMAIVIGGVVMVVVWWYAVDRGWERAL